MKTKMKMLETLKQFYCDHCGRIISSPEEGWVEFLSETNGIGFKYSGFRIVHNLPGFDGGSDCLRNFRKPNGGSIELDRLIGRTGINELLDFLDEGNVLDPIYRSGSIGDMREFVELFRRLTIPYYEEARQYWDQARTDGWFELHNTDGIYGEETLKKLIAYYSKLNSGLSF